MEVELMKPLDQTEMKKVMIQLDMLPQLALPHTNMPELPEIKFSGENNRTTATPLSYNPFLTSTTLTYPPSSMPIFLSSSSCQEPMTLPHLSSASFRTDSTISSLSQITNTSQKYFQTLSPTMSSCFPRAQEGTLIWPEAASDNLAPLMIDDPLGERNSVGSMREMIFRMAVMQPIQIDPESVKPAKRRNVRISRDPQSVAARHRREKISEKIRILQRLVPGGTKMDTACMLDEAIHYVKFLKKEVQSLERAGVVNRSFDGAVGLKGRTMLADVNYFTTIRHG